MTLSGKVLFITGASRGIGLAIATRAAQDGAKIAIAAKTVEENPRLPGTIYTAAEAVKAAGGEALPLVLDVRDEEAVKSAIAKTVETFGGIDILVNNAGAIQLTDVDHTDMKRYDLMQSINARAVFMMTKYALPYLRKAENPHVLNLSPPLNLHPGWLANHVAYTLSKYGMSLCTLGMAEEFKKDGIAVNSLWPETAVDTSAVRNLLGGDESVARSRSPEIVADAAHWIFSQPSRSVTGNFFIDSEVMQKAGWLDLSRYAMDPTKELIKDFFLGEPPKNLNLGAGKSPWGKPENGAGKRESSSVTVPKSDKAFDIGIDDSGVARLVLNRPQQGNCLTMEFFEELPVTAAELAKKKAKLLIIEAEGKNFCTGIDLNLLGNPDFLKNKTESEKEKLRKLVKKLQDSLSSLASAPYPVIACVSGYCLGAGLDLISACDMVYATHSAQFAIEEINVGLMADLGSLQRLPRLMAPSVVRHMAYTGERLKATAAKEAGLVLEVFPDKEAMQEAVNKTARTIASKVPSALVASKLALNYNDGKSIEESLQECTRLQAEMLDVPAVLKEVERIQTALAKLATRK